MKRYFYQLWYDAIRINYKYEFWKNQRAMLKLERANLRTAAAHNIMQAFEKTMVDLIVSAKDFKKAE